MKKIVPLFLLFFALTDLTVFAQTEQYASSVLAVSSEYGVSNEECSDGWATCKALGVFDVYPNYDDAPNAWASVEGDNQREFMELGFATPQDVESVFIYETYSPGAIDTVYLRNAVTAAWVKVWEGTAAAGPEEATIFTIQIPKTAYMVDAIRIAINSPAVAGWNEIDAVRIYTSTPIVTSVTGSAMETVQVAPNPSEGRFTVNFGGISATKAVSLRNAVGQEVLAIQDIVEDQVDIHAPLKEGVYYLQITSGSERSVQKLIIQ